MTCASSPRAIRSEKVVCYIVHDQHLLVLTHLDQPLSQTGIQVPAGTLQPGEDPAAGAVREASEETGLRGLRVVTLLGEDTYDLAPYRDELMHRRFFLLEVAVDGDADGGADVDVAARWEHTEPDPTGGGAPPRWQCSWLPLAAAHVLCCAQSRFVGAAARALSAPAQPSAAPVEPAITDHATSVWPGLGDPQHSARYVERFRSMAARGEDIEGESRLVDALAPRGARLLDAGCGPGRHGAHLARLGHQVVGVDLDPVLIAAARADYPEVTWLVGDLVTLDLAAQGEGQPFDGALLAGNVMDFVAAPHRAEAVRRVGAQLRPGGFLVIGCRVTRGFTPDELDAVLPGAGLRLTQRFATWDLQPWTPQAGFCVSVLHKDGR